MINIKSLTIFRSHYVAHNFTPSNWIDRFDDTGLFNNKIIINFYSGKTMKFKMIKITSSGVLDLEKKII